MRKRFENLTPDMPADFHASVLDALNRMEIVRLRRQRQERRIMAAAASIAAVFALCAVLIAGLYARPAREDAVVEPQEAAALPVAGDVSFKIENHYSEGECYVLDWTVDSTYDETILYEYEVRLMKGGKCYSETDGTNYTPNGDPGFHDSGNWPQNMALLGKNAAGYGLDTHVLQENWLNHFIWDAGYEDDQVEKVMLTVNFYRPKVEFCTAQAEAFSDARRWVVFESAAGLEAHPVNQCAISNGTRAFDETSMTILGEYNAYRSENHPQNEEEAWVQMRDYANLKRTALEMYGYAEWLKGYEVCIDLTGTESIVETKEVLQ